MKILAIGVNSPDYMQDDLYHGLKYLYGTDVECNVNLSYLYTDYTGIVGDLYGRGFTYAKNIDPALRVVVSQQDIVTRLKENYYSCVIYLSHRRSRFLIDEVKLYMRPSKIAVIDGEDDTDLVDIRGTIQFKRELLIAPSKTLLPISFAIQAEKICRYTPEKTKIISNQVPNSDRRYVFTTEYDYYEEYRSSVYAVTCKKAGWDCKRHYEIMAQSCIPIFDNIEDCPIHTMTTLPKKMFSEVRKNHGRVSETRTDEWRSFLMEWLWDSCTTAKLAKYVVTTLME